MTTAPMFRINAVVRMAIELNDGVPQEDQPVPMPARSASQKARVAVARIPRAEQTVRDACNALLEALSSIETEVERLRNIIELRDRGLELMPHLVRIGGDGVFLPKGVNFAHGTRVRVYLELEQRSQIHLLFLHAVVERRSEGAELRFENITADKSDFVVGYVFQQQAKERRRARNADDMD